MLLASGASSRVSSHFPVMGFLDVSTNAFEKCFDLWLCSVTVNYLPVPTCQPRYYGQEDVFPPG